MRSASFGVTISVTTVLATGLPSLRLVLVDRGAGRQHLAIADDDARGAVVLLPDRDDDVDPRSGTTKPATPMTSLTFTEMAR